MSVGTSSPLVEVSHLTVQFGDFKAVNDVSFTVGAGEIFGFLGANGAGKTTTIRVLCGLLKPTAGDVRLAGIDFAQGLNSEQAIKTKVGYMSQKFTLYNDLTVEENLNFTAALRKLDPAYYRKRRDELFRLISYDRGLDAKVADLSGGVKQQVSLAASMLHDPDIVFLDEPTAGVTPVSRARFWKLIRKIAAQGKTVFVTTHYMDEAEQCGRIALMRAGRLIALDTPGGLKKTAFPQPMFEFDPRGEIRFEEMNELKHHPAFSFFEPYGLRFHASIRSPALWDKYRPELEKRFVIRAIDPTLEDVFIKSVEGVEATAPEATRDLTAPATTTDASIPVASVRTQPRVSPGAGFVFERAWAICRKEVYHILRDPFTLILALVFPIFMVLMYGAAMDFNLKNISLAVSDADQTQSSRDLFQTFGSSRYFLLHNAGSPAQTVADVQGERAKAALIIPPRFEKDLFAGRQASAQVLVDGADNSAVSSILGYTAIIENMAGTRLVGPPAAPYPLELRTRFMFNPELNSTWFVIPGLMVVVMAILSIMLTALTVAREWENGSMELLLSTPVQPLEIIAGKLAPYGGLGLFAVTMTFVIARVVFHVPFAGGLSGLGVFGLGCGIFLCTYLAQGLLISVVARNQQVAMQMAMVSGLLPSNLLSGFVFPVASMPLFFRIFTMILPARWFMQISRYTFLRGSTFLQLDAAFLALSLLCFGMIRLGTRKFKRDLEP